MSAPRGIHWTNEEILDLLAIFSGNKVQRALEGCKRNQMVFKEVEKAMREKGHDRTWQECRNKTKAMRYEYKKAQNHNRTSGNAPYKCPYYDQLHALYWNDSSINPPGEKLDTCPMLGKLPEIPQDDSKNQFVIIDLKEVAHTTQDPDETLLPSTQDDPGREEKATQTEQGVREPLVAQQDGAGADVLKDKSALEEDHVFSDQDDEEVERIADAADPGLNLHHLPPQVRKAVVKAKKKRVSTLQRVGEHLVELAVSQHEEHMAVSREHDERMQEFLGLMHASLEEERRTRDELVRTRRILSGLLKKKLRERTCSCAKH